MRLARPVSGTSEIVEFRYVVVDGDEDTDGIAVPARGLALNGGQLLDASANGNGDRARFTIARAVEFPEHLVQAVTPRVEKIERLGNEVWVRFTRALKPVTLVPHLRKGAIGDQFRVSYSGYDGGEVRITDARIVRARGWDANCASTQADCQVVRLTLAASLGEGTVQIGYVPNPHFEKYRLRGVAGTLVPAFAGTEAVLLEAGDSPTLSVSDAQGFEQYWWKRTMQFHIDLKPAAKVEVTVKYATADGWERVDRLEARNYLSATAGRDYEPVNGTLTFAPGDTRKTISVTVIDDNVHDSGEIFAFILSDATGGAVFGDRYGRGTIGNDESRSRQSSRTFRRAMTAQPRSPSTSHSAKRWTRTRQRCWARSRRPEAR